MVSGRMLKATCPAQFFLHCDRDLSTAMTGKNGRHPLPSVETFTQLMGKIGIGSTTQVVVYDDTRGMITGYCGGCYAGLGMSQWRCLMAAGRPGWRQAVR